MASHRFDIDTSTGPAREGVLGGRAMLLVRVRLGRRGLVGGRAVVGHRNLISIGCGFCATWGCSGPA